MNAFRLHHLLTLACSSVTTSNSGSCSPTSKCAPCRVRTADGMNVTVGERPFPNLEHGNSQILKVNSLTDLHYPDSSSDIWLLHTFSWSEARPWWMQQGQDPWGESVYFDEHYIHPNHSFDDTVDDRMRWQCGYSYVVKTPEAYDSSKNYPVIIFLHGGVNRFPGSPITILSSFHVPDDDPYICVAPHKLEADWDPKKVQDVLAHVMQHLSVDSDRVYLTGVSMGGRGTFIVAANVQNTFAALMPHSPHSGPYSYVPLARDVSHFPIWFSQGDADITSRVSMALEMRDALLREGANLTFTIRAGVGHCCFENLYSEPDTIAWLLSWKRPGPNTTTRPGKRLGPSTTTRPDLLNSAAKSVFALPLVLVYIFSRHG